jgi:hypothetical protein
MTSLEQEIKVPLWIYPRRLATETKCESPTPPPGRAPASRSRPVSSSNLQ